jgi:regulatory protein
MAGRIGVMTAEGIGPEAIERWALAYLGRYASSAENLRRVLLRRVKRRLPAGADPPASAVEIIDAVVARARRSGLVDDDAYAAARARWWHRRGLPSHRIRARLRAKGVAPAAVAAAVAGLGADTAGSDLAAACAFARRRRFGPYRDGAADRARARRELAAFARAGFDRRVVELVLACADVAAAEELARGDRG